MATKTAEFDIDRYVGNWLARKISVRKIAAETGVKHSTVHARLKERCNELGINSDGGEGVGLWGVVLTEYLSPKKLAKMSDRDRLAVLEWAKTNQLAMLQMQGDRLYPAAKCANRTRRDTIGVKDLSEMGDNDIGQLWTGTVGDAMGLVDIPECEPIAVKVWQRPAAPLLLPLFLPRHIIGSR